LISSCQSTTSLVNTSLDLFNNSSLNDPNNYTDNSVSSLDTDILRTQSFILKNVINLLPILIESKRFLFTTIAEFYIGFLQSIYCLKTQFLSKLIKSKLFESHGKT
jgi:hypothetical protein